MSVAAANLVNMAFIIRTHGSTFQNKDWRDVIAIILNISRAAGGEKILRLRQGEQFQNDIVVRVGREIYSDLTEYRTQSLEKRKRYQQGIFLGFREIDFPSIPMVLNGEYLLINSVPETRNPITHRLELSHRNGWRPEYAATVDVPDNGKSSLLLVCSENLNRNIPYFI